MKGRGFTVVEQPHIDLPDRRGMGGAAHTFPYGN